MLFLQLTHIVAIIHPSPFSDTFLVFLSFYTKVQRPCSIPLLTWKSFVSSTKWLSEKKQPSVKYLRSLYFFDLHIKEKWRKMLQRDFCDYSQWMIIWVNLIILDNWSFNLSWFPVQYYYLHIASTNIPGHISRTSKNLIVICKTTTWQVSYKMRKQKH